MRHSFRSRPLCKLRSLVLLLLALVGLTLSPAGAAMDVQANTPVNFWTVTLSGKTDEICENDFVVFTVVWKNTDSARMRTSTLAPRALSFSANQGTTDPGMMNPATPSGVTEFYYTAGKAGNETVTVKLFNQDLEVAAQASVSFQVHECKYFYSLDAKFYFLHKDGLMDWLITVHAAGQLVKTNPNQSDVWEALEKTIRVNVKILRSDTGSECHYDTDQMANGVGWVDARLTANEAGFKLSIAPPYDFELIQNVGVVCPGSADRVIQSLDPFHSDDPWIEQLFSTGEGKIDIKISDLDRWRSNLDPAGVTMYTATLKLEKEVQD